jgi:hypothetical protein
VELLAGLVDLDHLNVLINKKVWRFLVVPVRYLKLRAIK